MTIEVVSGVLHCPLKPIPKLVLIILANHADRRGYCWPAVDTVGELAGIQRDAVMRNIRTLKEAGYLTKTHKGGNGPRDTSIYQLNQELILSHMSSARATHSADKGSAKSTLNDDKGSARATDSDHLRVAPELPDPFSKDLKRVVTKETVTTPKSVTVEQVVELYNATFKGHAVRQCDEITNKRRRNIDRAIKDKRWELYTPDDWHELFDYVKHSLFLMGKIPPQPGRRQFRLDIEFLTREETLARIKERFYHEQV